MLTGGEDNMQCQIGVYSCREHTMENSMMLHVLPLNICGTCIDPLTDMQTVHLYLGLKVWGKIAHSHKLLD